MKKTNRTTAGLTKKWFLKKREDKHKHTFSKSPMYLVKDKGLGE